MKALRKETVVDFLSDLDEKITTAPTKFAITSIRPDPNQPRNEIDQEELNNLVQSIKEVGILQPLLLRETHENPPYEIIAGERRWRAAKLAGFTEVPGHIRNDLAGVNIFLAQVIENANRSDLSDLQIAKSIKKIEETFPKLKKKDIASLLNKKPSYISRYLCLLEEEWQPLVSEGLITSAADLERLKSLDEESRNQLIDTARASSTPIGRSDIVSLLDATKAVNPTYSANDRQEITDNEIVEEEIVAHETTTIENEETDVSTSVADNTPREKITLPKTVNLKLLGGHINQIATILTPLMRDIDVPIELRMSYDLAASVMQKLGIHAEEGSNTANLIIEALTEKVSKEAR